MDRTTVDVYARKARQYRDARTVAGPDRAVALGRAVERGHARVDLGCGPGLATELLGEPVVALDAAIEMVRIARDRVPRALPVQADLEALPFRACAIGGAWASKCYHHVPRDRLPLALAELHWALSVGAAVELIMFAGGGERRTGNGDDFPGRLFSLWSPPALADVVAGAGFGIEDLRNEGDRLHLRARRLRSLPDTVGADMRLLVCGLNPSLFAADAGVPFARPGNRFWRAALDARLLSRDRDPVRALTHHGIGMTDVVKRATIRAAELRTAEYRDGLARVERLVGWLRPGAVCFVGLAGWRAAVDPTAVPGVQERDLAGVPVYVMPSTSGANAHARPADLEAHLRAAASLADTVR